MLKRVFVLAFMSAFSAGFLGCHAEGDVGKDNASVDTSSNDASYSKKTTEVKSPNGSYQKTETRTTQNP